MVVAYQKPRIAVVGSGVSGLAATWALNEHSDGEVHLFEADDRPGGHTNTVKFQRPNVDEGAEEVYVDTGFIVCNPPSYPNFLKFLNLPDVKVPVAKTEMTFSVSRDGGLFEWAGKDPATLFCQVQNLLKPGMWRMIWDILRFNASALSLIEEEEEPTDPFTKGTKEELSIGAYLDREGYSNEFIDDYLIPMTAAIWSTPPDTCALDFPARTLIRFMYNHHLLQVTGKPKWMTIPGGAHQYVKRILSQLPHGHLHLSTPVHAVSTLPNSSKVTLHLPSGVEEFDHVILATHSDTTLNMLRNGLGMTAEEERILGSFEWNKNRTVLHGDVDLMPRRRAAWSCWNYLTFSEINAQGEKRANTNKVALTYCMNHLQHISEKKHGPVLVTLNPPFEPRSDLVVAHAQYEHPVVSAASVRAQSELPRIQNTRGISYAGAWTKYGFHEDGFTSGLKAATSISHPNLRVMIPFSIRSPDRASESVLVRRTIEMVIGLGERARRVAAGWIWWAIGMAGTNKSKQKVA